MPLDPSLTEFTTTSPMALSLSFTEFATRTGLAILYAGTGRDAAAAQVFFLSSQVFRSDVIQQQYNGDHSVGFTIAGENNYDLVEITQPLTIVGNGLLQIGWGMLPNTNDQGHSTGNITAKLIRVRGGTETVIATGLSGDVTSTGTSPNFTGTQSAIILETTETQLTKGDFIRLSIEANEKKGSGSNAGIIVFGQDPQNRDGTNITPSSADVQTQMVLHVPVKII